AFGLRPGVARLGQFRVASRSSELVMEPQLFAFHIRSRALSLRGLLAEPAVLVAQIEYGENQDDGEDRVLVFHQVHWSRPACIFASSSSNWRICVVYWRSSVAALRYFSSSILVSRSSFCLSKACLAGLFTNDATEPRCSTGRRFAVSPWPLAAPGSLTPSPLPVSSRIECSVARRFCVS